MQQAVGRLIGKCIFVDGTLLPINMLRRGAKEDAKLRLGRSVGGSTKSTISCLCFGKPMNFVLTGGERHEAVTFPELVKEKKIKLVRDEVGLSIAVGIAGDKTYSSQETTTASSGHNSIVIPSKQRETTQTVQSGLYRSWPSGRLINQPLVPAGSDTLRKVAIIPSDARGCCHSPLVGMMHAAA